jgi:hypothetical protein
VPRCSPPSWPTRAGDLAANLDWAELAELPMAELGQVPDQGRPVGPRRRGSAPCACGLHKFLTAIHTGGRSAQDIDAGGVLPGYQGTIVRDGHAGYRHLSDAVHA